MMPVAGQPGASAMLRVRLKADGRLVEILPDGSERAIPSDPRSIATAAHQAARSVDAVRNWEQGKRSPRGPARALLKVLEQAPDAAFAVLAKANSR
jgi:putative transcriptional regulator